MSNIDEELTQKTLSALNDMRIKFPGKNDEEAEYILDKVTHYDCPSKILQLHYVPCLT